MYTKIKNISDAVLCSALFIFIIILTVFSDEARQGAKLGFGICEGVILPSLLPVLIICNFIIKSRLSGLFEKAFSFPFERILKLPRESAGAVLLGLVSGYPSGAMLTLSLFERRLISENEAKRIMSFNVCGGAAFIITGVGTVVYGNTKTGVLLYCTNVIASLLTALITGIKSKPVSKKTNANYSYPDNVEAFCKSVEVTVKALAVMCAYITLFSVITNIIHPPRTVIPLLEITNGVCGENTVSVDFAAMYIAFGGVCIHLQLLPFLTKMKIGYLSFLSGRIFCAAISFILCRAYLYIFPESTAVFNNVAPHTNALSSGGTAFSVLMIICCSVIVFEFENKKIKLHY